MAPPQSSALSLLQVAQTRWSQLPLVRLLLQSLYPVSSPPLDTLTPSCLSCIVVPRTAHSAWGEAALVQSRAGQSPPPASWWCVVLDAPPRHKLAQDHSETLLWKCQTCKYFPSLDLAMYALLSCWTVSHSLNTGEEKILLLLLVQVGAETASWTPITQTLLAVLPLKNRQK